MTFMLLAEGAYHAYETHEAQSGLFTAFECSKEAWKSGSSVDILESTFESGGKMATCAQLILSFPARLGTVGAQVTALAADFVATVSPILTNIPLAQILDTAAIFIGVLSVCKEVLGLSRQLYFIQLFNQSSWKQNPVEAVEDLKQKHPLFFKRSLPEWLNQKIIGPQMPEQEKRERAVMKDLLGPSLYTDPQPFQSSLSPQEQVDKIHEYVVKKALYHGLLIVAAVLAVAVSLATLGLPLLISLSIMTVLSIVLMIGCALYKEGVLDNPEGGFSLMPYLSREFNL